MPLIQIMPDSEHGPELMFLCPGCRCGHGVWTKERPGHPKWEFNGDVNNPTIGGSVMIHYGHVYHNHLPGVDSVCHSTVTQGKIFFHADCTHKLVNQTVPLEPF